MIVTIPYEFPIVYLELPMLTHTLNKIPQRIAHKDVHQLRRSKQLGFLNCNVIGAKICTPIANMLYDLYHITSLNH